MSAPTLATFDDYKRRLYGDADLWQLRGEWWHVVGQNTGPNIVAYREPRAPREAPRQRHEFLDRWWVW